MKAASVKQIKDEMQTLNAAQVQEICLRLVKFKKEAKELATYLLFYKDEEQEFVQDIKAVLDEQYALINSSTAYFAKKGLRKLIRLAGRYTKYTSVPSSNLEIYIYLGQLLQGVPASFKKVQQIKNMFSSVTKKIEVIYASLHPDLQFDYKTQLEALENF